jgi:hypothetical protein
MGTKNCPKTSAVNVSSREREGLKGIVTYPTFNHDIAIN